MKHKVVLYTSVVFAGVFLVAGTFFVLRSVRSVQESASMVDTGAQLRHLDESVENTILQLQIESEPLLLEPIKPTSNPCAAPEKSIDPEDHFLANVGPGTSVPAEYIPLNLVEIPKSMRITGSVCLYKDAAEHLADMFKDAKAEDLTLYVTSGFRSFERQAAILEATKAWKGDDAYKSVALPGHSEHQLGVAVDLTGASVDYASTAYDFGATPEGVWLAKNSYKYGFVLSYPEGKESITGYIYEPWHFRYIGVDLAKEIYDSSLTIREYLDTKTTIDPD